MTTSSTLFSPIPPRFLHHYSIVPFISVHRSRVIILRRERYLQSPKIELRDRFEEFETAASQGPHGGCKGVIGRRRGALLILRR